MVGVVTNGLTKFGQRKFNESLVARRYWITRRRHVRPNLRCCLDNVAKVDKVPV